MMEENGDWKKELAAILKSRKAIWAYVIVGALVAVRAAINLWTAPKVAVAIIRVQTAKPLREALDVRLDLPANLEAIEQADIYAHVSGYLKDLRVDEGDSVKQGQVLATIDAPDVTQAYNRAKADNQYEQVTLQRYQALLKQSVISDEEYDKVESDADRAKARYDNAKANLGYTLVTAPFSGQIARRYMYVGDFVQAPTEGKAPTPIFTLINQGVIRIAVDIPQRNVGMIALGDSVDVRVDSFPGEVFHGIISRIDELLNAVTKTQRALIDIPNRRGQLQAGMFASAVLHLREPVTLVVPMKAVEQDDGGGSYVYVLGVGNQVHRVNVALGETQAGQAQIIGGGLGPADDVVTDSDAELEDGDIVRPVEAPSASPQGGSAAPED